MSSSALSGFGTTLKWNTVALAELLNVSGPGIKVNAIDVTSDDSTSGFIEVIGGLGDGGEFTAELNFIPGDTTGQIALITDMIAKTKREVILTGPTAGAYTWTATCLCTNIEPAHPMDDKLTLSVTFKVSGVPTLAVTASANMSAFSGIEENAGGALAFDPAFAAGTYSYGCIVNTASTWVKLTVTHATAATITVTSKSPTGTVLSGPSSLTTTVQSGAITLGAADTLTIVTVTVQVTGQMAKTYTLYISRP